MKLAKAISKRLKALRQASGLSQQEIATKADLSLSLVAKMEQGKKADPRASTLLALARALGVRPGELLDELYPTDSPDQADATHESNGTSPADLNGHACSIEPEAEATSTATAPAPEKTVKTEKKKKPKKKARRK